MITYLGTYSKSIFHYNTFSRAVIVITHFISLPASKKPAQLYYMMSVQPAVSRQGTVQAGTMY